MASTLTKEMLLQAAHSNDVNVLVDAMPLKRGKVDAACIAELLNQMTRSELSGFFQVIVVRTQNIFHEYLHEADNHVGQDESVQKDSKYLELIAQVLYVYCKTIDRNPVQEATVLAITLHDVLLQLPRFSVTANTICLVCERYWKLSWQKKESLILQSIPYLIAVSLEDGLDAINFDVSDLENRDTRPTKALIQRIFQFKDALAVMDFDDESIAPLRGMLLRCILHPSFLSENDGQRFIVSLFGIHLPFIDEIHSTIKNQILYANKNQISSYGDIYFKAWSVATGPYLMKIERSCIQDLMFHAVHASSSRLAGKLFRLLGCLHSKKAQKGVDEMLSRLYEPILWRALKVANPLVRKNAAVLLGDAFPLQDLDDNAGDIDVNIQRQLNYMEALLEDDAIIVRCAGVQVICRSLCVFWELIPAAWVRSVLTKLTCDLAYDSSSALVRSSVVDGITYLLQDPAHHQTIKVLLPQLKNLVHDTSERVRKSFVDLLIKVKSVRAIRYFDIVPVDQLLIRLTVDSPEIVSKITSLLSNSLFPQNSSLASLVDRCARLLDMNHRAAVVFYKNIRKFVPHESVYLLAEGLYKKAAAGLLDTEDQVPVVIIEDEEAASNSRKKKKKTTKSKISAKEVVREDADQNPAAEVTPKNHALNERMLTVSFVLWESLIDRTYKKKPTQDYPKMIKEVIELYPLSAILDEMKTPAARSAIYRTFGAMQEANIHMIEIDSIDRLKRIKEHTTDVEVDSLLICICRSGRQDEVLDMIIQSLKPENAESAKDPLTGKSRKLGGSKESSKSAHSIVHPLVSMDYLNRLLREEEMRKVTTENVEKLMEVINVMQEALFEFDSHFQQEPSIYSKDVLLRCLDLYLRILFHASGTVEHVHDQEAKLHLPPDFGEIVEWVSAHLFEAYPTIKSEPETADFCHSIIMTILVYSSECLTLGLDTPEIVNSLVTLCSRASGIDHEEIVKYCGKIIFQMMGRLDVGRQVEKLTMDLLSSIELRRWRLWRPIFQAILVQSRRYDLNERFVPIFVEVIIKRDKPEPGADGDLTDASFGQHLAPLLVSSVATLTAATESLLELVHSEAYKDEIQIGALVSCWKCLYLCAKARSVAFPKSLVESLGQSILAHQQLAPLVRSEAEAIIAAIRHGDKVTVPDSPRAL